MQQWDIEVIVHKHNEQKILASDGRLMYPDAHVYSSFVASLLFGFLPYCLPFSLLYISMLMYTFASIQNYGIPSHFEIMELCRAIAA
jgi:hypothetical protein